MKVRNRYEVIELMGTIAEWRNVAAENDDLYQKIWGMISSRNVADNDDTKQRAISFSVPAGTGDVFIERVRRSARNVDAAAPVATTDGEKR